MPENLTMQPIPSLRRDIGIGGAMMMGLGSIVGTGVFVSIAIATGIAGADVIFAITIAALVAICNGLSSAQLAANYPVSGGTYEYGYRLLPTSLGFIAGWMFLFAKSASAATAALGLSGYLLVIIGADQGQYGNFVSVTIALLVLLLLTVLTLIGIKRTNSINILIVSVTLISLVCFIVMGLPLATSNFRENLSEAIFNRLTFAAKPTMARASSGHSFDVCGLYGIRQDRHVGRRSKSATSNDPASSHCDAGSFDAVVLRRRVYRRWCRRRR